jgi:hypothetical protein
MKERDQRNQAEMPDEKVKDKGHEVPVDRAWKSEETGVAVMVLTKCGYVNDEITKIDEGIMNEVRG